MTIQECYENIGANYDEILGRIGKTERIEKFLKLFLKDDSYGIWTESSPTARPCWGLPSTGPCSQS